MKGAKSKDDKSLKRKGAASKEGKASKRQAGKAAKDPNKPKRPASAFFVFLEEFRKTYKAENPTVKAVAAVGKAGGDKWKSMSDAEKAPFVAKAEKRKVEYEKQMKSYNQGKSGASAEESDKSKSEINDEEGSGEDEVDED